MTDEALRNKQMERIRALLARTTANGCTEAEAKAAADLVDKLMTDYEINLDDVAVNAQDVVEIEIAAYAHSVRFVARQVGEFCDCKSWTAKHRGSLVFLGLELDTEIAEYLVVLFMRAMDRETGDYIVMNSEYALADRAKQANMELSFQVGLADRLGERLIELKSNRDFTQKSRGFDLVVSKGHMVKAAFDTLGINLSHVNLGGTVGNKDAYAAGKKAGDNVGIHQGVGRNAATNSRIRG